MMYEHTYVCTPSLSDAQGRLHKHPAIDYFFFFFAYIGCCNYRTTFFLSFGEMFSFGKAIF